MGGSWRVGFALLSAFASGTTGFVLKAPLPNNGAAASAVRRPATAACPLYAARSTAAAGSDGVAAPPPRTPWTCLAPGGKVGRAKVSLERAVTSVAAPKSESAQETKKKQVTKTKRATETEDAPMFQVLVIGDEEYNREHVVMSIQDIVPDTDNTRAAEIFEEAQEGGKGFCGTYPEEEAELYVEQFTRCEPIIYADMEKEGAQKGAEAGASA
ncbi:unnamed protein product [Ectocarpus sp. 6 AP-2014]